LGKEVWVFSSSRSIRDLIPLWYEAVKPAAHVVSLDTADNRVNLASWLPAFQQNGPFAEAQCSTRRWRVMTCIETNKSQWILTVVWCSIVDATGATEPGPPKP
jgi:hypothetical protein